jgi:hypothetical protein
MPSVILSDNGVSSGSAGLKTSADSSGSLALQTSTGSGTATTALTIDTSQNVGIGTNSPQSLFNTASTGQVQIGTASWPTNFVGKSNARTIVGNEGILLLWNEATASAGNEAAIIIGPKGSGTNGSTIIAGGAIKGVSESSSTNAGALTFSTNGGTGNGERMRIDSSGNVGIGTTAPNFKLSFGANIGKTFALFENAGTSVYGIGMGGAGTGGDPYRLKLFSNGTENACITDGGNVGIGTSSPTTVGGVALCVYDSSAPRIRLTNSTTGNTSTVGGELTIAGSDFIMENRTASANIRWYNNGSERMRINSSGVLLVGKTSADESETSAGFSAVQTAGGAPVVAITNSSSSGDAAPALCLYKASTTTSSSARFLQFYANNGGQPMGGIVGNGATNAQFASISDAREKTNIQPISGSLDKVLALKPVEFDWIADNTHTPAGFIAQDVQEVFPEYVVQNMANEGDEQRYGLTGGMTGGIIPHLVKAIQELNAKVTALEAK